MRNGPRRLDHVAVLVGETNSALEHFSSRLGLAVVHTESIRIPPVRLTYLELGNAYLQLVEPLEPDSPIARTLRTEGEGLHHVCFGSDDVLDAAAELAGNDAGPPQLGSGRGRISAFVPGEPRHRVRIEFTEFHEEEDVEQREGWIP